MQAVIFLNIIVGIFGNSYEKVRLPHVVYTLYPSVAVQQLCFTNIAGGHDTRWRQVLDREA